MNVDVQKSKCHTEDELFLFMCDNVLCATTKEETRLHMRTSFLVFVGLDRSRRAADPRPKFFLLELISIQRAPNSIDAPRQTLFLAAVACT